MWNLVREIFPFILQFHQFKHLEIHWLIQKGLYNYIAYLVYVLVDAKDCKQAVRWLCDYIKMQATKEQLHHSKDLHTMIVAAFNTILIWAKERPSLLSSKVQSHYHN